MPTPQCTRTITGLVSGDLVVDSGVTCLRGATVKGSVRVGPGASLFALESTIEKDVTSAGAAMIELVKSQLRGAAQLDARLAPVLFETTVRGRVTM